MISICHRWSTSFSSQEKLVRTFFENFADQKNDVCTSLAAANIGQQTNSQLRKIVPGTGTGRGEEAEAGTGKGTEVGSILSPKMKIKRWIRLARINIGLPSVTYTDSE